MTAGLFDAEAIGRRRRASRARGPSSIDEVRAREKSGGSRKNEHSSVDYLRATSNLVLTPFRNAPGRPAPRPAPVAAARRGSLRHLLRAGLDAIPRRRDLRRAALCSAAYVDRAFIACLVGARAAVVSVHQSHLSSWPGSRPRRRRLRRSRPRQSSANRRRRQGIASKEIMPF